MKIPRIITPEFFRANFRLADPAIFEQHCPNGGELSLAMIIKLKLAGAYVVRMTDCLDQEDVLKFEKRLIEFININNDKLNKINIDWDDGNRTFYDRDLKWVRNEIEIDVCVAVWEALAPHIEGS